VWVITGGIAVCLFLWVAVEFIKDHQRNAPRIKELKEFNKRFNKPEPKVKMPTKEELRRGGYEIEEENRILDEWEELRRGLDE